MALTGFTYYPERLQKRWVVAALAIALFFHVGVAGVFELYKIPRLQIPAQHSDQLGPFTVKQVEIDPNALKPDQPNPIAKLPSAEPPKNPAEFNLDPNLVEKALQTPQPALRAPTLPDPTRVVAASDLSQSLPYVQADNAGVTADISKIAPVAASTDPLTSSRMAEDILNSSQGTPQAGTPAGSVGANDNGTANVPGFGHLAPAVAPDLTHLPEPIMLRLPADVLFDFDSADLKPEASTLLAQAALMIGKYPDANIQVDGYSDSFGRPDYNLTLSQQRAQAVQAWLQSHAPAGSYKFQAQGHGSADYVIDPQGSIDQQQPNRRVEIVIQALKPQ
jgi:outer membrane protein OmpA-like peptidoglycan-associated protein